MQPFHPPGKVTSRGWTDANYQQAGQDAKQRIISDMAYSHAYGFGATRLPTPGAVIPAAETEKRMQQVADGWKGEAPRTVGTRGLDPTEVLTPLEQQHFAERLRAYPQTATPLHAPAGYVPGERW